MSRKGFTIVDLMVTIAIIALVSAIAIPAYTEYADRASNVQAMADIFELQIALERFNAENFRYPDALADLEPGVPTTDPWGVAYAYLRIEGNLTPGLKGKQRKDKNLNPLNLDFDLYSMGKNRDSKMPLTAKASQDDVIRAQNGAFVGLAKDH